MTDRSDHLDDSQVVALAVGELTGRERASALEHLLACRTCRDEVDSLVAVSEELLLLAPEAEPAAGFESAVLGTLDLPSSTRSATRRSRTVLGAVAAAVAILVAGVALGALATARHAAPALAEAPMVTPTGLDVGSAWSTGSDPGWILVSVPGWAVWEDPATEPGAYELRVELADGSRVDFGPVTFRDDTGSWATTTTLEPDEIRSIAVVDETGHVWCSATFDA